MDNRIYTMAVLAWSLVSIGNLPAQDNRNSNTKQPTLEDRIDQLEQDDQNLKGQVDQLRNDFADLQDRVKRLEQGGRLPQAPPAAARPKEPSRNTSSGKAQTSDSGAQQSYDVFYQGLQSGGHWFEDPTYGEVWQPDVAASESNWRPYSDGHWAYTDQGWTWISNEDFGWATYHYGRWARRSDTGWVWIPGSRWAPAWVSWRESSDDVGWAPLPPEVADDSETHVGGWVDNYYDIGPAAYSFVKIVDLSRPTYRDVILTPENNVELFSSTRNVTDIVYSDNAVAVNGPHYEQVASQVKIPSYKLNYVTANEGRFGINTRGDQLQVMAPPLQLQQSGTVEPKIEKTLGQAQVERGWQEIDQQKVAQLKQKMQRQAPVPASLPPKPTPPRPVMAKAQNQPTPNAQNQQTPNAPSRPPANTQNQPPANTQNQRTPNLQNQPAEKADQQQTSGQPSGSDASSQTQQRSGIQQATPAPQEQRSRPEPSPSRAAGEQNDQRKKPTQQEANAPREQTDQPGAPSPTSRRSEENQKQMRDAPPSTPSRSGTPRAETPAPAESPDPRRSTQRGEREHQTTEPTSPRSEESRSHTPTTDQPPLKEWPNAGNQFPREPAKEESNETRKLAEPSRNEAVKDGTSDRATHSENQPEANKGQRGEPQRSTEARPQAEEKQSERTSPDYDRSGKQGSKKPKKEEPQSEQPR
jgi:hypothetical protein